MRTDQLLESLSNCLTIDTASGNLYVYGNLQQEAVKSAVLYADSNGKIIAAPAGVGIGGATSIGAADLTATGTRNDTTYLRGDNTWAVIDLSGYQPLDADLTAISNLADSSGLLRKVDSLTWSIDSKEYIDIEAGDGRYQVQRLINNLTQYPTSIDRYPTVNAVNNGLATKMGINGGTFTGSLTISTGSPTLLLNDDGGTSWRIVNEGSTLKFNYSSSNVNKFNMFASGNAEFVNNLSVGGTLTGSSTASFTSSVTASAFFESSDKNLKALLKSDYIPYGIERVESRLYIKNNKEELGYFAQDVESILPSAVTVNDNGFLSLSYREVHTAKIAYLEKEVKELKAQLARL